MSNTNAIAPYLGATAADLAEAGGITQFQGVETWYQTIGGVLVQGGLTDFIAANTVFSVDFPAGIPKQLLTILASPLGSVLADWSIDNVSLSGFDIRNGNSTRRFYWEAKGV